MDNRMDVHILDDDPDIRRLIARLAESAGHHTRQFESAAEFRASLPSLEYGCIMLDITMPDCCGLDLLADLGARDSAWPVIIISGTTDVEYAITAFRRGAYQFLRKPFRREEFLHALASAAEAVDERTAAEQKRRQAKAILLTSREREVLGAMNSG